MKNIMKNIYSAFDTLTITEFHKGEKVEGIYPVFFPLVGLVMGLILCLVFAMFYLFFPLHIAIIFTIFAYIVFTGAKHVDDFADYVDALLGGRTVEQRRKILTDPDAGTFAIIAILFLVVLYFEILSQFGSDIVFVSLFLMPAFARWSILYPLYEEIETNEVKRYSKFDLYIITIVIAGVGILLIGWHALVLMMVAAILASVVFHKSSKLFGSIHQDVQGFIIELNSVLFLFGLYILITLF